MVDDWQKSKLDDWQKSMETMVQVGLVSKKDIAL